MVKWLQEKAGHLRAAVKGGFGPFKDEDFDGELG